MSTPPPPLIGSAADIYQQLVDGATIQLTFPTLPEAVRLRNSVATIKYRQDKIALEVGLCEKGDLPSLHCTYVSKEPPFPTTITLSLSTDSRKKNLYTYTILASPTADSNSSEEAKEV